MLLNIHKEGKLGTSVCFFYLSSALHTTDPFLFLKILCPVSLDLHNAHTIQAILVFLCLYFSIFAGSPSSDPQRQAVWGSGLFPSHLVLRPLSPRVSNVCICVNTVPVCSPNPNPHLLIRLPI